MIAAAKTTSVEPARMRALIIPREHGAWGLLLIPLFTGACAGLARTQRPLPIVLLTIVALSLFWLRTPVESLLGSGVIAARTSSERKTAFVASLVLALVSITCLTALMWKGRNTGLLLLGSIAAIALIGQAVLRKVGRQLRMASQLIGAIGLTATAPAVYYLATGHLNSSALILWAANWLFAGDQIHFVQLRIRAARASGFREKLAKGRLFLVGQLTLLTGLMLTSLWRVIPLLVVVPFVPVLVRGTRWFFQKPEPLDVKKLGWSEMKHGIVFGILLAIAFVL
jgi:hypothetical protein